MNYKLLCINIWTIWWFTITITCSPLLQNQESIENQKVHLNQDMIKFMQKFGYMDQDGPQALTAKDELMTALKLVQKFGGLKQTGVLDNDTLKLVKSKRCGVPDILKQKITKNKRFVTPSNGWNKRALTYFISNFTPKLSRDGIRNAIQSAFSKWSRYSRIIFTEVYNGNADILISFGVSNHGDQFPFDGPGNVLAHAFYPTELGVLGGDIHFDDSEDWTLDNSNYGVDFYSVAIHEMGHSLGLGHSSEPNSIMNPYYTGPQPQDIGYDDILGMHSLYISRTLPGDHVHFVESTIQPQPSIPNKPHVHWSSFSHESCTDDNVVTPESVTTYKPEISTQKNDKIDECLGNFDAISCIRGEIFVFKNSLLWRLNNPGSILPRYPVQLLRFFQVLADSNQTIVKIDAVYERPDSNIVLFHGNSFYVFNGNHLIENSPRSIMDYGFPHFVNKVDAVMIHGIPSITYLFRHRSIKEHFKGVKTPIDDVLTWKFGDTFFFTGNQFWKFNHKYNKTEDGYPKNAAEFLLGCS
ncbi:matrix metalloproteinase-17-like isoform X2 [Melanaphis sacchari]|uniref:matrix metalloproteinase-17-like isoform X2 n=1 Tax=Melanaphis sacchari TaxID=742174 RepID=UPI000DC12F2F|nr:matrix metalloproteinase-17-like isoform X2 [Melanaphis sacchari]